MRYNVFHQQPLKGFFLTAALIMLLCSCAANRGNNSVASQDALTSDRRGSYKTKIDKVEDEQEGRRRSQSQSEEGKEEKSNLRRGHGGQKELSDKEAEEGQVHEEGKGEEKDRALFTPYNPEDKAQSQKTPPSMMPSEIKQKILSSGADTSGEEYVTLNFENAAIDDIINTVSEYIGLNYIMGTGVKGQISMQTSKPVPISELFPILQSVLEVNGLTMIPSGRYFKVIYAKEASQYPIEVMAGKGGDNLPQEETYITQIISLEYIPVKDMIAILQPFLSKSAPRPIQHDDLNLMIINDTANNMKRLLKFVQELDKPLYQPKEKVFVYYVENGDAKKLATTLTSIYKKGTAKKDDWRSPIQQPAGAPKVPNQPVPNSPFGFPPFGGSDGGDVQGDVTIVAAEDINGLVVTTSPRNWLAVLETIKKLDIQPKQALIEVLVAEISIDDIKDFGLDWTLSGGPASGGTSYRIGQKIGDRLSGNTSDLDALPDGISYMINRQDRFLSLINTKADENKLNVLSSPHVLASDNQEATIEITQDYPVARESYDANSQRTTITYDYKTAGIKLNFTPNINEKGMVSLKLKQEVSQLAPGSSDTKYIFSTRKAETSVVVHNGETLVIGGLIKEQKSKSRTGIPFFGDIPILGYLFSRTKDTVNKTELIILITPHIVNSEGEGRSLTKQFQERLKNLTEKIDKRDHPSVTVKPAGTTAN
ncbi:MAG: secretin N-terminal domain-containing protein [bacterium]